MVRTSSVPMQLDAWMAATGRSDESLAQEANVDRSTISRLRRHKSKPSPELAHLLVRLSQGAVTLNDLFGLTLEAAA